MFTVLCSQNTSLNELTDNMKELKKLKHTQVSFGIKKYN